MSRLMDDVNGINYKNGKMEIKNNNCIDHNRQINLNFSNEQKRLDEIEHLNMNKQFLNNQSPINKIHVSTSGLSSGFSGHEDFNVRKRILGKTLEELHTKTYQKKDLNKPLSLGPVKGGERRLDDPSEITSFPKTDSNIECFQNYQKKMGASGFLVNTVDKLPVKDGWRPPKTTGRETMSSLDISNFKGNEKLILKFKDNAKTTKRQNQPGLANTNVTGNKKSTSIPNDKLKKTVRETLQNLDITNLTGNKKSTSLPNDKLKKTVRETLESNDITNVTGSKKSTSLPNDKLKKTIRETLKSNSLTNVSGNKKSTSLPNDKLKKTIRETLKSNSLTNVSGNTKSTSLPNDKLKKTGRETLKSNSLTNVTGNKKLSLKYDDKAKKTQREIYNKVKPSNVIGTLKPTEHYIDKMRITKNELNIKNKNYGMSGPAINVHKKFVDKLSSENMIFKAHGKTEKKNRLSNLQSKGKIIEKKLIGRVEDRHKMKVKSLQQNFQPVKQQNPVGSSQINKCNFKSRSLKNNRTFNSDFIKSIVENQKKYEAEMNLKKRDLGKELKFKDLQSTDDKLRNKKIEINNYQRENDEQINKMLLNSILDDLRDEAVLNSTNLLN